MLRYSRFWNVGASWNDRTQLLKTYALLSPDELFQNRVCDIEVIKEGFMRLVELPNNLQNAR